MALAAFAVTLLVPAAAAATFGFTGTQPTVAFGAGIQTSGADNGNTYQLAVTSNPYAGGTMSFVSVGDIQTFFLGTVRSQESSVNANGTDTLSMQISIILGGQTFVLAPSVSASTTNNNITFTSGSDYTAVQNMLVSGDLQYKIGAIVQWSNDGSNWTTNPTTATSGNGQTRYYRVSFRLLDIPAPEPSTYALMGTGLAGMLLLRRRIS